MKMTTDLRRLIDVVDTSQLISRSKMEEINYDHAEKNLPFDFKIVLRTLGVPQTILALNSVIEDNSDLIKRLAIHLAEYVLFIFEYEYPKQKGAKLMLSLAKEKVEGRPENALLVDDYESYFGKLITCASASIQAQLAIIKTLEMINTGNTELIEDVFTYSLSALYFKYDSIKEFKREKKKFFNLITRIMNGIK